ncbi:MAG: hypothetical protein ACIAS6_11360 [Phycisphaerales bacterium JB060]
MTALPRKPASSRRHRVRRVLAWVCRATLFVVVVAFATGRGLSDQYSWSQWLFWIPPEAWLVPVWVLTLATALAEPPGPFRRWARLGPMLAAVVVTGYVTVAHWRLHNALLRSSGPTMLRVYHWNATEATDPSLHAFLREADPFGIDHDAPAVVVLANPPLRLDWPEIVRMLGDQEMPARSVTRHVRRGGRFVILSGPPMTSAGWTALELNAKTMDPDVIDNGTAMYARIDLSGTAVSLWAIDWPSTPTRSRMDYVPATLQRIDSSSRRVFEPTQAGPLKQRQERGFPRPDIVIGDFNTARGSAAIERLLPGMASAHAQAGIGPDYGWPRFVYDGQRDRHLVPFLGLDQAFVRRGRWRATAYRMLDLGEGTHRAQEMYITPRD